MRKIKSRDDEEYGEDRGEMQQEMRKKIPKNGKENLLLTSYVLKEYKFQHYAK